MSKSIFILAYKFLVSAKHFIILLFFVYGMFNLNNITAKWNFIRVSENEILIRAQNFFEEKKYEEAKLLSCYIVSSDGFNENIKQTSKDICEKSEEILSSKTYKIKKCVSSMINGKPDDLNSFFCVLFSDITIFGDIRDIVRESIKYFRNEEVDEFVVGLSMLGVASPIFDFLKILKKSSSLNENMAQSILKDKKLAENVWEFSKDWYKQAGAQSLISVLKFAKTPQEFNNLSKYTKTYGPETTYIAVTKTKGKILEEYKPLILYTNSYHLFRIGLKDFIGKDGYQIIVLSLLNMFKEKLGKNYFWILSLFISFLYLIVSNLFPPRDIKISVMFSLLILLISLLFLRY